MEDSEVDERGVRLNSVFYPHTLNCFRSSTSMTNPQPCTCGGHELLEKMKGE
jgi:hypothetical protein